MVDYRHPERPEERLSNAEREAAIATLRRHAEDGRITPQELEERAASVAVARTREDVIGPFVDLPELPDTVPYGRPSGPPAFDPPASGRSVSKGPEPDRPGLDFPPPAFTPRRVRPRAPRRGGIQPLGGRLGATVMAVTPVAAVLLFFVTGVVSGFAWAWLWFLAIPLVGGILYAPWYEEE